MRQHWLQAWWTAPRFRHLMLEGLIAVCLAFLVWLYIHSRARETLDHVPIPVAVQLPAHQRDQFLLEVPATPRVIASFLGPASRIRELRHKLQRGQVKVALEYVVPSGRMQDTQFTDRIQVEPAQLPAPPGVTVELVEESRTFPINVQRLGERLLPVKLEHTGDARVSQLRLEPPVVLVRGPKGLLDRAQVIGTTPYSFAIPTDDASDPFVKDQVAIASEVGGQAIQVIPPNISFRCKISPNKRTYDLLDVPVHFLCPELFPWRPRFLEERQGKITLRLVGPTSDDPPPVLAYVDLTKGTFGRGRNLEPVRLQLPKDFQLADNAPLLVAFQLEELDRPIATVNDQFEKNGATDQHGLNTDKRP